MKKCPRCKKQTLEDDQVMNSLSHRDRKVYICNRCGNEESWIDAGIQEPDQVERDFAKICGKETKLNIQDD